VNAVLACGHDGSTGTHGVCAHVRAGASHRERFTGVGIECDLVCSDCVSVVEVDRVCTACRDAAKQTDNDGYLNAPGIVDEPSALRFEHLKPFLAPAAIRAIAAWPGGDRDRWIAVTAERDLVELDLDRNETHRVLTLQDELFAIPEHEGTDASTAREAPPLTLHVSRNGAYVAIVQEDYGRHCVVVDLDARIQALTLQRDTYCLEHCVHSFAFVEHLGRTLVVHASAWNRLDVYDPHTKELLTPRGPTSYSRDEERPEHYLDYFHCGLAASPDSKWIVDNGWVWHPVGVMHAWSVEDWLTKNVWESEDGPSKFEIGWGDGWDLPLCWIDDTRVAVWGYGTDEQKLLDAVRIENVDTRERERWFAGPSGELVFDRVLFAFSQQHGATVWNVERGTRLLSEPRSPTRFHPTAKTFLRFDGREIHRSRLLGLDASYRTGAIAELADRIAREHAYDDLPVLGDALEAAGCTDREMLAHCQQPGPHVDRCWVIERLR
jgi:hypothetical protein